jgi:hypothetical protein
MRTAFLLLLVVSFGCSSQGDTHSPLDAEEFAKSYGDSPSKYKGKVLTIRGRVIGEIVPVFVDDKDAKPPVEEEKEKPQILLEGTAPGMNELRILCEIAKDSQKDTKKIKSSQQVTIRGTCGGRSGPAILMENCTIVK